jgi:hypothetical protein
MTPQGRASKNWTFSLGGFAVLALALGASWLYRSYFVSDPVLAAILHAVGYRASDRMWIPGQVVRGEPMVERLPLQTAGDARALAPIKFLGAGGYLGSDDEAGGSFVYHADAGLPRTGSPSRSRIAGKTASGRYYEVLAHGPSIFGTRNAITVEMAVEDGRRIASRTSYATRGTPATLTSADLDGDGKPDLVVVSADTDGGVSTISVFPGVGDGTYKARADYPAGLATKGVTVADVNNDARPDLIVVGRQTPGSPIDAAVEVFLNKGDGRFLAPISVAKIAGGWQAEFAAIADLNHDGKPDIVTNDGHVLLGDGKGHFKLMEGSQFAAADSIAAADFNRDGKIDIATVNFSVNPIYQNTVGIFLGNGDGTFRAGQRYASIYSGNEIGVRDLHGDGKLDLVVGVTDADGAGAANAPHAYLIPGRGDGTFAAATYYAAAGDGFDVGPSFALADLNGDRRPDILTTTVVPSQGLALYTLTGHGDGVFDRGTARVLRAASAGDKTIVVAGDLNADGKSDAIVATTTNPAGPSGGGAGNLAVFLGNGDDTFGVEHDTAFPSAASAMAAGDFNNDRMLDVVAGGVVRTDAQSNPVSGAVFLMKGRNDGSFDAPVQVAAARNPVSIAAADLNGDRNLDLVIADRGAPDANAPGSVTVLLGKGNGTFEPAARLGAPAFPEGAVVADVNHDGRPDIVVLSSPGFAGRAIASIVYVFPGDGKGNFGPASTTRLDEYADGLQVADLNGDGLADLAVASCCGLANSEVWTGNGDGTFAGPTELPVGISSSNPMLADLNGDGIPDLIVSNGNGIQALVNISGDHDQNLKLPAGARGGL